MRVSVRKWEEEVGSELGKCERNDVLKELKVIGNEAEKEAWR